MRRVKIVLVSTLLSHSLLMLPLEAKLTLVTISPTIVTMKLYELRFWLERGLLIWLLLTRLLTLLLSNHSPKSSQTSPVFGNHLLGEEI
jgi:hypothetical protein